ncbi:MAG: hypothetical protein ACK5H2_04875, partial [Beutenbergiaceae bacterium]
MSNRRARYMILGLAILFQLNGSHAAASAMPLPRPYVVGIAEDDGFLLEDRHNRSNWNPSTPPTFANMELSPQERQAIIDAWRVWSQYCTGTTSALANGQAADPACVITP